jgi:hypothetical protein
MVSAPRKRRTDGRDEAQARAIAETSAFITQCLRQPELAVRIPIIPVGQGEFPPSLSSAFWEPILYE